MEKLKEIMFDLFDTYEDCDDIIDALRGLNSCEEITEDEYDYCINNWDDILKEWEAK